jgi:OmpA-OmpF porin, OOP family
MKDKKIKYNHPTCIIIVISVFLLITNYVFAIVGGNTSDNKNIDDLRATAIRYDRKKDIYNAIYYYSQYLAYRSSDVRLTYRLATLCFTTRDYLKAYQLYDSVLEKHPKKYPLAYYRKGIVCMNLEEYDEAIKSFTQFRKVYKKNSGKYDYRKLALVYIESSGWAKNHPETNGNIAITHPGSDVNHATIDFSPYPANDNTIFYGSVYSDSSGYSTPVRQIFKAERVNGKWKTLGLMDGIINLPALNTGNAVLSDSGRRLFFTRTVKNWQNADVSEIFVSNFNDGAWQNPVKLPYPVNIGNYTSTQPAVGKNLRTGNDIVYFVSDRPGGKGGLDIWYTEFNKKTNSYKTPVNLDRNINSMGDECSPFYDGSTGTLYFSSKGRKNALGGYDIYKVQGSARKWTETTPLPKPINSPYDDYYFSILKNNKEGFFTSNRPGAMNMGNGSCCDDIFSFRINECVKIHSFGTIENSVNYDLYNDLNQKYNLGLKLPENGAVLPDIPVELYLSGEKDNEQILISKTTTNRAGMYEFELDPNKHYEILVQNYGYFEKKRPLNTTGINCSDTIRLGISSISYLPKISVKVNIYYDHDKYKLSGNACQTIDSLLVPLFSYFPTAIVEIGSHTDNTGNDSYNMKLSQRRSESVVDYLISKGISGDRLVAKGYGLRFPIAPNTNVDGSDNPSGRQLNRRTEITIVGEISVTNKEE